MDDELVTLTSFASQEEAELARAVLDAAGIRSFLEGGNLVGMAWHLANAIGGVKLLVPSQDAAAAAATLQSASTDEISSLEEAAGPFEDYDELLAAEGIDGEAVRSIDRAWRASLIGVICLPLPPLLHVYSLYILLSTGNGELPPQSRRRFVVALLIDAVMIGGTMILIFGSA